MHEADDFPGIRQIPALRFTDCAESALLVEFCGDTTSAGLERHILEIARTLTAAGRRDILDCVPGLSSLTVIYNPLALDRSELLDLVRDANIPGIDKRPPGRTWTIPACYDTPFGPDLQSVAGATGISPGRIPGLHSSPVYRVRMLGFLPGFVYMGDVPAALRIPRRADPRQNVPAGSVAIAAGMTAIYPVESPGGWHVIARTPVRLWDLPAKREPLIQPGDRVRFQAVANDDYAAIETVAAGGWRPDPDAL